jgi:hypothetical protein
MLQRGEVYNHFRYSRQLPSLWEEGPCINLLHYSSDILPACRPIELVEEQWKQLLWRVEVLGASMIDICFFSSPF